MKLRLINDSMKIKVKKTNINKEFIINKYLPANYSDAFECIAPLADEVTPSDLQIAFMERSKCRASILFDRSDCRHRVSYSASASRLVSPSPTLVYTSDRQLFALFLAIPPLFTTIHYPYYTDFP
jgi:hypothetical protein